MIVHKLIEIHAGTTQVGTPIAYTANKMQNGVERATPTCRSVTLSNIGGEPS